MGEGGGQTVYHVGGDYVAGDKIVRDGIGAGEPLDDLLPKVPRICRGTVRLGAVFVDLPVDSYLYEGQGALKCSVRAEEQGTFLPRAATAFEYLTTCNFGKRVLVGPGGSGKTTILKQLAGHFREHGRAVLVLDARERFGAVIVSSYGNAVGPLEPQQIVRQLTSDFRADGAILVDHLYYMEDKHVAWSSRVVDELIRQYEPRLVVVTKTSLNWPRVNFIDETFLTVRLVNPGAGLLQIIQTKYQNYLRDGERLTPPSRGLTVFQALSAVGQPDVEMSAIVEQLSDVIDADPAADVVSAQLANFALRAYARASSGVTELHALECFGGQTPILRAPLVGKILERLCKIRVLTEGVDRKTYYFTDPALVKVLAAQSNALDDLSLNGYDELYEYRIRSITPTNAELTLRRLLTGIVEDESGPEGELQSIQRASSLVALFVRTHGDPSLELRTKGEVLAQRLFVAIPKVRNVEAREEVIRDYVELRSSLGGNFGETIRFARIAPGRAKLAIPGTEEVQMYDYKSAFYIAETPITVAQYINFYKQLTGKELRSSYADRQLLDPMTQVTWRECIEFAVTLNSTVSDCEVDLPTIDEWTLAADGNLGTPSQIAIHKSIHHRAPIRLNEFHAVGRTFDTGILEWTKTSWGSDELNVSGFPTKYDSGDGRNTIDVPGMRLLRGSSWLFSENSAMCACILPQDAKFDDVGFRLVLRMASGTYAQVLQMSCKEGNVELWPSNEA